MRRARIEDTWRRLRARSKTRLIQSVEVEWRGVPRFPDDSFRFDAPITLLCGENGAGKSTLLHLVSSAIESSERSANRYVRSHNGTISRLVVTLFQQESTSVSSLENGEAHSHFYPEGEASRVSLIDTGMHVPALLTYFGAQDFESLLEGVQGREFSRIERELASFIVGRDYSSIVVYEVGDTDFGEDCPYFQATSYGVQYSSQDMGYGELAILYVIWSLSRAPNGSLLLIEEPEAFLSPRAQVALVDVLARFALEKGLQVLMTSHSGSIATRLLPNEMVYVTRSSARVLLTKPPANYELVHRLGLIPSRSTLYFVEDHVSMLFLREILDGFSERLAGIGEIQVCSGGESAVRSLLAAIPAGLRSVVHVGVLDGDQAIDVSNKLRILCLPGGVAPEQLIRDFVRGSSIEEMAAVLQRDVGVVGRAIANGNGQDVHEWAGVVSRTIGVDRDQFCSQLIRSWADHNVGLVNQFLVELETLLAP